MNEIEQHPFEAFIPENATILILGSFPGKEQTQGNIDKSKEWFYGAKRNQFWKIISSVYDEPSLKEKETSYKMDLFSKAGVAVTDIILKARRKDGKSLDANLEIVEYNYPKIESILKDSNIKSIFFTSKFVEKHFKKHFDSLFPEIKNRESLPSPSPRFTMKFEEKINHYKKKFPKLKCLPTHKQTSCTLQIVFQSCFQIFSRILRNRWLSYPLIINFYREPKMSGQLIICLFR